MARSGILLKSFTLEINLVSYSSTNNTMCILFTNKEMLGLNISQELYQQDLCIEAFLTKSHHVNYILHYGYCKGYGSKGLWSTLSKSFASVTFHYCSLLRYLGGD